MNIRQDSPPATKIRELYGELWDQTGPKQINMGLLEENEPPLELNETIQPITVAEIRNRIMKIKNSSAARIDGIKKCHLTQVGTVELLAILFNILLVEGHSLYHGRSIGLH